MSTSGVASILLGAALVAGSISIVPILPVVLILAALFVILLAVGADHGLRISGPVPWLLAYIGVTLLYAAVIGVDFTNPQLYRREFKFIVPFGAFVVFSSLRYPATVDRTVRRALKFIVAANLLLFLMSPLLAATGWMQGLYADDGNIWDAYSSFFIYLGPFFSHSGGGGWYATVAVIFLSLWREPGLPPKLRSGFLKAALFFFLLLALALSRAYLLASVVVLAGLFLRKFLERRFFLGLTTATVLAVGGVGIPFLGLQINATTQVLLTTDLSTPAYNVMARYVLWGKALEDFVLSPLVGVGVTRFDDELTVIATIPYGVPALREIPPRPEYFQAPLLRVNVGDAQAHTDQQAHNMYLHVLAEGGLLMFTLMVLTIAGMLRWTAEVERVSTGFRRGLARGLRWAIFVVLVAAFFGNSFFTVTPMFFLMTLGGYLNSVVPLAGSAASPREAR